MRRFEVDMGTHRFRALFAVAMVSCSAGEAWAEKPDATPLGSISGASIVDADRGHASFSVASDAESRSLILVASTRRGAEPFAFSLSATEGDPANVSPSRTLPEPPRPRTTSVPASSRGLDSVGPASNAIPPASRVFSVLAKVGDPASASNYDEVQAVLRAVGRAVQIYVDEEDAARVRPETLRDAVATFDQDIEPAARRRFGIARDVDGDGRLTILFTSRMPGGGGVDGFVRAADFDPEIAAPFGNRGDLICLDASLGPGPYLRTLLAHEYAHAVLISRKADATGVVDAGEESWLDEAIAHCVEDSHGFSRANLDYRVMAYLAAPERYGLVVEDYHGAGLFRSHGHRGASYLFLSWCLDRFGPDLLETLVRSPLRGLENLEAATSRPFEELFRLWTLDLTLGRTNAPASPRIRWLEAGGPAEVWTMPGTSFHAVIVRGSPTGAVALELQGPPGADLQVTVLPLPDVRVPPRFSARVESIGGDPPRLAFEIRGRSRNPLELVSIAWGPLAPKSRPEAEHPARGEFGREALRTAFGRIDLPPRSRLQSVTGLGPDLPPGHEPLALRLTAVDPEGRLFHAWTEVELSPRPDAGSP